MQLAVELTDAGQAVAQPLLLAEQDRDINAALNIRQNEFSDLWIRKENYCQIITKNGELL
ncbi:hypothetical protein KEP72_24760 [Escherichia coli]|nr:hypothetical protein [Escherichia coli]